MGRPAIGSKPHERALAAADARLARAKERITIAALSCLRGDVDAAARVRDALDEVERARQQLATLEAVVSG